MTRKLTQLIAGFSVCIPASAFALGLGQIEVRSALNQPLDAEIPLVSVDAEELPVLTARLASSELFSQYGIERLPLLLALDFSVETDAAGRHVIQVSSKQPIREPLINFLVQVDGPDGQLLREYGVLLDLPTVTLQQPTANSDRAQRAASVQTDAGYGDPVLNTEAAHRGTVSYGPVAYGETLWDIAGRVRPDSSIDRERMMQALLEANPEAFFRPDIDSLSAGATLRVPSAEELDPVRFSESTSRQLAQQQAISTVADETVSPALPEDDLPRVRLVPPDAEQASSTAETADAEGSGSGVAPPFRIKLEDDRPQLRIAGVSELRERLGELPRPGATEQSANTPVQSDADAVTSAQEQASSTDSTSEQSTTQAETSTGIATPSLDTTAQEALPQIGRPQQPAFTSLEDSVAESEVQQTIPTEAPAVDSGSASEIENATRADTETVNTGVTSSSAANTSSNPNLDASDGVLSESNDSDSGMFSFLKDPISLAMIGSLLLFLIALPLFLLGRRRGNDDKSAPVFEAVSPEGVAIEDAALVAEPASSAAVSEPAERTRTEPLAKTTLTGSEANPLEQADLLIAVGNYKEAEQLMRRALLRSPNDAALASKLLDIHFAAGNAEAFAKDAQLLRDRLGDESDPLWMQVATRGRELCPENRLFANNSEEFVSSESTTQSPPSDVDEENDKSGLVTTPHDNSGLAFDLKTGPAIFDKNPVEPSQDSSASASSQDPERTETRSDLEWVLPDMESESSQDSSASESSQDPERTETRSDLEWVLPDMEPPTVATTGVLDEETQQGDMESELKGIDFEFEEVKPSQETATDDPLSLNIDQEKVESTEEAASHQTQDLAAELKSQSDTLNIFLDNLNEKFASPNTGGINSEQAQDLEAEAKPQEEGLTFGPDNSGENTTFDAGEKTAFDTGENTTFDTGENTTFDTGENTADTGENTAFDTGENTTFDTGENTAFDTGENTAFDTGENTAFDTGENTAFDTGENTTFGLDEKTTFVDIDQEDLSASEDYVQTKLDLAVAYMDMGDSVGARSLLQEVMREGTDSQKQHAEECVAKLG